MPHPEEVLGEQLGIFVVRRVRPCHLLAERHARVDDLALLIDLVTAGWRSVEHRLMRLEASLDQRGGAVVYRMEERRPTDSQAG